MGSEDKEHPLSKFVLPLVGAMLISGLSAGAGMIYKHDVDIRKILRKVERFNVDKYRRNLSHYRNHYTEAKDCVIRNKRILRSLEDIASDHILIPIAENSIDMCEEEKALWSELIENYVEENKHMGYD